MPAAGSSGGGRGSGTRSVDAAETGITADQAGTARAADAGRDDAHWTIAQVLAAAGAFLGRHGSPSARLDAELLLAHCLSATRVRLYTHFDQPLSPGERACFRALVRRRATGEPVAYLLGRREFYGRDFQVTAATLIPRPETEHVVEAALAALRLRAPAGGVDVEGGASASPSTTAIADIGTGSGALAVTLAAEWPSAQLWATDLSAAALAVARSNAAAHGVAERITFAEGDLLAPLPAAPPFDVVVSNPPYVDHATRAELSRDVADHEPALALFADDKGLAIIARLCAAVPAYLCSGGLLLCEIGADQRDRALALVAGDVWREAAVLPDLAGLPRVLRAVRR